MPPVDDPVILVAQGVQALIIEKLRARHCLIGPLREPVSTVVPELDVKEARHVRVLVTLGTAETSRPIMAALPQLGLICCTGAGYEGVDLAAARELGIGVTHSPAVTASSVADLAVALLIASVRGMMQANATLRVKGWVRPWPAQRGLTGMRVGVYGFGVIGQKVASRLDAFDVQLGYCTRTSSSYVPYKRFETVLALAAWADAIIVCASANAQTIGAVDAAVLAALGPQGHLINVARAAIVDHEALCEALERGTIAGAGLDVLDSAYLQRLLAHPTATVTPHIAGVTTQAEEGMCRLVSQNIQAFLDGAPLPTPVPGSLRIPRRAVHTNTPESC